MFKNSDPQHPSKHVRLRIESCVDTILEFNERLGEGQIKPEIIRQFERLREAVSRLSDDRVSEEDLKRIEQATNDLLADLQGVYGVDSALRAHVKEWH